MEHVFAIFGTAGVAGLVTLIGNVYFEQGWGIIPFLVIWAILLVVIYGGFLILDGDVF